MTALTSAEIDQMRLDAESILDSTCTIQVLTRAGDGMGGWPDTWANTYTGVACLMSVPSRAERTDTSGERFKVHSNWILSVHWDQAVAVGNRVIFGSDTFAVVGVEDDQDMRILRQVDLLRIDG